MAQRVSSFDFRKENLNFYPNFNYFKFKTFKILLLITTIRPVLFYKYNRLDLGA